MPDPQLTLQISNLSKTYPNGVQALKNLSLTIGTNMFGLLGPNGAGKSTLMRTVATLQDADSGEVSFDGLNVLREKDSVRRILGYLTGVRCISENVGAGHARSSGRDEGHSQPRRAQGDGGRAAAANQ